MKEMEENRELAIANSIGEQVKKLMHAHASKIEQAAAECECEDNKKPVEAKVSFAVKWPAGAESPHVNVAMSYSIKYKDESDEVVDAGQGKFDL